MPDGTAEHDYIRFRQTFGEPGHADIDRTQCHGCIQTLLTAADPDDPFRQPPRLQGHAE